MAPTGQHPATPDQWLSIREAADLIGVSPATLRRWSDAGEIEAFTTPGGHRRFSRRAVEAMLPAAEGTRSVREMGVTPERLARIYHRLANRMVADTPWARALDSAQRGPYREHGRRIGSALVYYLDAPDEVSREAAIVIAEEACREYGRLAAEDGSGLAEAIELFMRFRMVFLREMTSLARRHALDIVEATSLLESTHRAFDRLLHAILVAYQANASPAIAASPTDEPSVPASNGRGPR